MSLRVAVVLGGLWAVAVGCGDGASTASTTPPEERLPGSWPLLTWSEVKSAPGSGAVLLSAWTAGDSDWRPDAPGATVLNLIDGPRLQLGAGRPEQAMRLEHAATWDRAPTRLEVHTRFGGQGRLLARLHRGDGLLATSEPVSLVSGEDDQVVSVALPALDVVPDRVELVCEGAFRRLTLERVEAWIDPSWQALDGAVQRVDGVWLAGRVVRPGSAWQVTVPEGVAAATLSWESRVPAGAREGVTLLGGGGLSEVRGGAGWDLTSAEVRGGDVVTLQVQAPDGVAPGDPELALFLTQPRLQLADAGPTTVVLITGHAHRGDHLGLAFRGVDIDTPALDALAAEGVLFSEAQTCTDLTVGALAALHTGRTPRDTLLLDPGDALAAEATTLAERFAAAGWTTLAAVGDRRWLPGGQGLHQGFQRMAGPEAGVWTADRVVDAAARLLDAVDDGPRFLWVQLADGAWPHRPEPATLMPRYHDPGDDPRHEGLKHPKVVAQTMPLEYRGVRDLRWTRANYKARLTEMDRELERLLALPQLEHAVVAYTSDHGLSLGEHAIWFKHMGLYPGVLQVPLIVADRRDGLAPASGGPPAAGRGPSGFPAGTRCATRVTSLDLGVTLLSLAGVPRGDHGGEDLAAVVAGRRDPGPLFAVERHGLAAAATDGDLHLVFNLRQRRIPHLLERRKEGEPELYDLAADWLGEQPAPEGSQADTQRLGFLLQDWLRETEDLGWRERRPVDPSVLERLEALGYVQPWPVTSGDPWAVARLELR